MMESIGKVVGLDNCPRCNKPFLHGQLCYGVRDKERRAIIPVCISCVKANEKAMGVSIYQSNNVLRGLN